jgi:hypothetical protein
MKRRVTVPLCQDAREPGVVSHRSAAALYGLGHLAADQHEFTVPARRQTRRPDTRIHVRHLHDGEWASQGGLLVTRPQRTSADLIRSREDPAAVAQVVADALRHGYAPPGEFAAALAPSAAVYGFRRVDGMSLLQRCGARNSCTGRRPRRRITGGTPG